MSEDAASGRTLDFDEVEAELLFVDPAGGRPRVHLAKPSEVDPERTRGTFVPRPMTVRNGRRLGREASLDEEGFAFIRHVSNVTDFYNDAEIRAVYYPEIEALVKQFTGASRAVVFDHTVRGTHAGPRGDVEVELPSDMMHCDFTAASALETLQYLVPPEEREAMQRGRIVQMNLWRPIRGPLRTMPLAVCNATSVKRESCIEAPFVRPDFESEYTLLAYDAEQRWYYLPDMRADEVIVIKNYDSDESKSPFAIHGAFAEPGAPPDAPPRESIEVRVFAAL